MFRVFTDELLSLSLNFYVNRTPFHCCFLNRCASALNAISRAGTIDLNTDQVKWEGIVVSVRGKSQFSRRLAALRSYSEIKLGSEEGVFHVKGFLFNVKLSHRVLSCVNVM